MNGVEEQAEEGEVDSTSAAPKKVHIRGLDSLTHHDILQWIEENHSMDLFKKVEWIDDTSANLLYDTEAAAAEALTALSSEETVEPLQLRPAKRYSGHPGIELMTRQAIVADVKVPGAKDRSKFYLFRKEWDPDNPDNIRPGNKRRRHQDDDRTNLKYRRRDYEHPRYDRGSSRPEATFHEDMYGEDPQSSNASRKNSSAGEHHRHQDRPDTELLPGKQQGRLRNRSASPIRDEDGRFGFEEVHPLRRTARARSRTPPDVRAGQNNRGARNALRKELFPGKVSSVSTTASIAPGRNGDRFEMFQDSPPRTKSNRELFPDRLNGSAHRRQTAKDLHPDEVADAIGRYSIDGTSEQSTYHKSGRRPEHSDRAAQRDGGTGKDLFSRISGGPKIESSYGRLAESDTAKSVAASFSIKGASHRDSDQENFTVLGASQQRVQNPLVKELFPMKTRTGNGGGDLFDGRIKGRASQRRRAEDMF